MSDWVSATRMGDEVVWVNLAQVRTMEWTGDRTAIHFGHVTGAGSMAEVLYVKETAEVLLGKDISEGSTTVF
jgi:hypothetical protein